MLSEQELSTYVQLIMKCPLGVAFMQSIELANIDIGAAAKPTTALWLLTLALTDTDYWRTGKAEHFHTLLSDGPRLQDLATQFLAHEGARWMVDADTPGPQILSRLPDTLPLESGYTGQRRPSDHELYSQSSDRAIYTSTECERVSSYIVGSMICCRDLGPLSYPYQLVRLVPSPDVKVYTINRPDDWRELCLEYPAKDLGGLGGDLITPDYSHVAREWDAIHLSFLGLITSDQVRIENTRVTALQGWDTEQTLWFRPAFDEVSRIGQIDAPVDSSYF